MWFQPARLWRWLYYCWDLAVPFPLPHDLHWIAAAVHADQVASATKEMCIFLIFARVEYLNQEGVVFFRNLSTYIYRINWGNRGYNLPSPKCILTPLLFRNKIQFANFSCVYRIILLCRYTKNRSIMEMTTITGGVRNWEASPTVFLGSSCSTWGFIFFSMENSQKFPCMTTRCLNPIQCGILYG